MGLPRLFPSFGGLFQFQAKLFFLIPEAGGLLEMLFGDRLLLLGTGFLDLLVQGFELRRTVE